MSRMTRQLAVVILCLAVAGTTAAAQTVLIDYNDEQPGWLHDSTVREGDFTDLIDTDWSPWVNLGNEDQENIRTDGPCGVGSDPHVVLEGGGDRIIARDTGHTLVASDTFDLSFMWYPKGGTDNGEQAALSLYYTDDNLIDGTPTVVATLGSTAATPGDWYMAYETNVTVSGDGGGGKTLFIKIEAADLAGEYSRVDNVYVALSGYDARYVTNSGPRPALFDDDFEDTTSPPTEANLEGGIADGAGDWSNVTEVDSIIADDGGVKALQLQRTGTAAVPSFQANLTQAAELSRNPQVSTDICAVWGQLPNTSKYAYIDGYDSGDTLLFSVRVDQQWSRAGDMAYSTNGTTYVNVYTSDSTTIGVLGGGSTGTFDSGNLKRLEINLHTDSWDLWFDADGNGERNLEQTVLLACDYVEGLPYINAPGGDLAYLKLWGTDYPNSGCVFDWILVNQDPPPAGTVVFIR